MFQIKNQPEILNEYDEGFKESEFQNMKLNWGDATTQERQIVREHRT